MLSKSREEKGQLAQFVTMIAGALAEDKSPNATASVLSIRLGVPEGVLRAVLVLAMSRPVTYGVAVIPASSAQAISSGQEATYRALYVWNAVQRVMADKDRTLALEREKTYFNEHIAAMRNRRNAASAVDRARGRFGTTLGWNATKDKDTSPECREADGKNFDVNRIPAIGWPGAVHPFCRCRAGARHHTWKTVYSIVPERSTA